MQALQQAVHESQQNMQQHLEVVDRVLAALDGCSWRGHAKQDGARGKTIARSTLPFWFFFPFLFRFCETRFLLSFRISSITCRTLKHIVSCQRER